MRARLRSVCRLTRHTNLDLSSVTVVSFFCYVQIQKKELTVSVAFTAMSLFGMLQSPLTNLPMFVSAADFVQSSSCG